MKKKVILAVAAMMVFALAAVTFAFVSTSSRTSASAMDCCCKGDSCPMKKKAESGKESASCCDNCDCCKGDSCPMKAKKSEGAAAETHKGMEHSGATSETKTCDCSCCKDKQKKTTSAV